VSPNRYEVLAMSAALTPLLGAAPIPTEPAVGTREQTARSPAGEGASAATEAASVVQQLADELAARGGSGDVREVRQRLAQLDWSDPALQQALAENGLSEAEVRAEVSAALAHGAQAPPAPAPAAPADRELLPPGLRKGRHAAPSVPPAWSRARASTSGAPSAPSSGAPAPAPAPTPADAAAADETTTALDAEVLVAAQRVLAAMCHPSVCDTSVGLIEGAKHVVVKLGATGVLWLSCPPVRDEAAWRSLTERSFFAASVEAGFDYTLLRAPPARLVNATGAGDTLVGTTCAALARGATMHDALRWGMAGARLSVQSQLAVPAELSNGRDWPASFEEVCRLNPEDDATDDAAGGGGAGRDVNPWEQLQLAATEHNADVGAVERAVARVAEQAREQVVRRAVEGPRSHAQAWRVARYAATHQAADPSASAERA
jgi:hypothetical protein